MVSGRRRVELHFGPSCEVAARLMAGVRNKRSAHVGRT